MGVTATSTPADERAQTRLQLLDLERLDQVVVRPRPQTLDLVVERVARRQHENGRVAPRILAQAPAKRHAVDSGKNQVEHDRVPIPGHGEVKPGHSVARVVNEEAAPFEKRVDHLRDVAVVLDDQDGLAALWRGHGIARCDITADVTRRIGPDSPVKRLARASIGIAERIVLLPDAPGAPSSRGWPNTTRAQRRHRLPPGEARGALEPHLPPSGPHRAHVLRAHRSLRRARNSERIGRGALIDLFEQFAQLRIVGQPRLGHLREYRASDPR